MSANLALKMAKTESRLTYLETQLAGCLENVDAFSVQLSVIQDFLQKQFGSRFVDYAMNRGVYIDKPVPVKGAGPEGRATLTQAGGYEDEEYGEDEEGHEEDGVADPAAFLEVVDEGQDQDEGGLDEIQGNGDCEDEYYDETEGGMEQELYEYEGEGDDGTFTNSNSADSGELVIVNCVSEQAKIQAKKAATKLPSPPPITARPPATKSYSKVEAQKVKPLPNILARKRPAASLVEGASATKMPTLLPQVTIDVQNMYEAADAEDSADYSMGGEDGDDGSGLGYLDTTGTGAGEGQEDLREYYDVLPDKSVQCKICAKVLKAGWHKFGRHYRTHTGEKPFSCPICGESFARKDNMNNHVKSKHENKRKGTGTTGGEFKREEEYAYSYDYGGY